MRKIGSFVRDGEGFSGSIISLSVQALDVRIVPNTGHMANDPTHVVYVGDAVLGAALAGPAKRQDAVLELQLDDPSFAAPIIAELVGRADGDFDLIWRRG